MIKSIYPVLTTEKLLPFYLTGIGVTDPEYHVYRDKGLASHQFLFTTEGEGVLKINGKTFKLTAGDFLYLPPGIPHEYYPAGDESCDALNKASEKKNVNWKTFWCVFRGENLLSIMENLGFKEFQIKKMSDSSKIHKLFLKIFKLAENSDSGELCSQFLYEYIITVKHFLFDAEAVIDNPKIKNCLKYIDANFRKDITDEELAQAAGCSVQYLCRIFKKSMGIRPLEFIAKKRVAEAKNLIDSTELSLTEISRQLGFDSLNYFGMVFKKYEGISASEYKSRGKSLV